MDRSLSVLLPVRNVESTLAQTVQELLDVLPELTRHFELVIVDDGSQDATIEVADELAMRYPQIRVVRHGEPRGRAAAIETALQRSCGEVVFLRDDGCRLAIDEALRLWRALDAHDFALGCPDSGVPEPKWNLRTRLSPSAGAGFQMAFRRAVEPIRESLTDQASLRDRLARLGCRWHEVAIRGPRPPRGSGRKALVETRARRPNAPECAPVLPERRPAPPPPKAPNYLSRLRDFALGE